MCTLTYIPHSKDGFLFTTNRDESPLRAPARRPERRKIGDREVLFPVDGQAGGTWVAVADDRRTACLLNGAYERHQMGGTYRLSRGIMVLESFNYADFDAFVSGFDFEGIEPFTFVSYEKGRLEEIRWDGKALNRAGFDPQRPHIWSSAQLYKPEVIQQREVWFREWRARQPAFSLDGIRRFHEFGGSGDIYNDLRMNRNGLVRTVSTTAIENVKGSVRMHYEDLLRGGSAEEKIVVKKV